MLNKDIAERIEKIAENRFRYMTYGQVAKDAAIDLTVLLDKVLRLPSPNIRDVSKDDYFAYRTALANALVGLDTLAIAMATNDMELMDELDVLHPEENQDV